ncbi:MAG: CHAP domain-containing protein [Pseudotabrizicola sp.]|uniref:CHAP domain-containing protein n=1 Tax=Pseudotabrizicola sp. TaxID=2939647 RepID=UPI00271F0BC6|nr:CHAP domain-containing protein [Pseudotabrizicola sp.]MDO9637422.1 CHAP domain-containing protein [Pseudotabrizicola sp.]
MTRLMHGFARTTFLCASLVLLTACGDAITKSSMGASAPATLNPELQAKAIAEVREKQAKGARVWCVPFARTASGVELTGNAGTWWTAAKGVYSRGNEPEAGAVMVFAPHSSSRLGHVAVVSEVVSDREVLIDHANWTRNKVSLKMPVYDVSANNDWSRIQVEGTPGVLGDARPVHGFVYPRKIGPQPVAAGVSKS